MTDYVKSTNFTSKDSLASGNPLKIIKGTEFDIEFNNIAVATATKADIISPAFSGVPTAPTAIPGTNTTQIATTAFVATKADIASPTFTGTPAAPTASVNTNTTQVATTAFVVAQIADDAPTKTGTGASGSWNINAATATKLSTASGNAPSYSARAWVNFDGTGTIGTNQTIRASGNVISIFKNGTGDYTINFTSLMPNENFSFNGSAMQGPIFAPGLIVVPFNSSIYANTYTDNSVRIKILVASSGDVTDAFVCNIVVFC